jgi:hypothetical protein
MQSDSTLFAGVDLSFGRKPIMLAGLDEELKITILEKWDIAAALACLQEYENVCLAINVPSSKTKQSTYVNFKKQIAVAGFRAFSKTDQSKQCFESNAQDCYREWIGQNALSRRTFEGRLQRALILHEHGLRIKDPMDIFEEVTRFKLIHGTFRFESLYSAKELDALVAAHLAWMSVNRPARIMTKAGLVLPAQE